MNKPESGGPASQPEAAQGGSWQLFLLLAIIGLGVLALVGKTLGLF
jgi:hypothetical protein